MLVDDAAVPVGVEPGLAALFVDVIADLDHRAQAIGGFPEAAEHDLIVLRRIADEVDDLLCGRLTLLKPEIVPLKGVFFVAHAEGAAVGTAVGEIDVEIVPELVDVSIHMTTPFVLACRRATCACGLVTSVSETAEGRSPKSDAVISPHLPRAVPPAAVR